MTGTLQSISPALHPLDRGAADTVFLREGAQRQPFRSLGAYLARRRGEPRGAAYRLPFGLCAGQPGLRALNQQVALELGPVAMTPMVSFPAALVESTPPRARQ